MSQSLLLSPVATMPLPSPLSSPSPFKMPKLNFPPPGYAPTPPSCIPCLKCGQVLNSKSEYDAHVQKFHPIIADRLDFRCEVCHRSFLKRDDLSKHSKNFHLKETCLVCERQILGASAMLYHIKIDHVIKSNSQGCDGCRIELNSPELLLRHFYETHVSRCCAICNMPMDNDIVSLLQHLRRYHSERNGNSNHQIIKPASNNVGSILKNSKNENLKKKRNFCAPCNEILPNAIKLKEHVERKHPLSERQLNLNKYNQLNPVVKLPKLEILHTCSSCDYQTLQRSNLARHFESIHITFKCRECDQGYKGRKAIIDHVRKNHPNKDDRYDMKDAFEKKELEQFRQVKENSSSRILGRKEKYSCPSCLFNTSLYSTWIKHKCSSNETSKERVKDSVGKSVVGPLKESILVQQKFKCPHCEVSYAMGSLLASHITNEHGKKVTYFNDLNKEEQLSKSNPENKFDDKISVDDDCGSDTDSAPDVPAEEPHPQQVPAKPVEIQTLLRTEMEKYLGFRELENFRFTYPMISRPDRGWNFDRAFDVALVAVTKSTMKEKVNVSVVSMDFFDENVECLENLSSH